MPLALIDPSSCPPPLITKLTDGSKLDRQRVRVFNYLILKEIFPGFHLLISKMVANITRREIRISKIKNIDYFSVLMSYRLFDLLADQPRVDLT